MSQYLTVQEYAETSGVTESNVYDQVKKGNIGEINVKHDLPKLIIPSGKKHAEIISFMNLKGGAGKTTLSVNFSVLLSKMGLKVLLIDTDHQNHCRLFFKEMEYSKSVVDLLTKPGEIESCIYQANSGASIVDIIFSSHELPFITSEIKNEYTLQKNLEKVVDQYDFIVIDTPPAFDIITINCAKASTALIIPMMPEPMHYEGMNHYIGALTLQDIPKDNIKGIVFNRVHEKVAQHKAYIEILREQYKNFCFPTFVPYDPHIPKTQDTILDVRTNIFDYRERSKASVAIKKMTWEILRSL